MHPIVRVLWKPVACVLVASMGYLYIQGLNAKISELEIRLQTAVEGVQTLQEGFTEQRKAMDAWRASQEALESAQSEQKARIDYVLRNSKGNARVVDPRVIDELCTGTASKYCASTIKRRSASSANSTM